MTPSVYLSDISKFWPFARQERDLGAAVPGYPDAVRVYRDEVDPRLRRSHTAAMLPRRAELLRSSTRASGGEIYIASLAVFAWTVEEMLDSLTFVASKRSVLVVLDAGLRIGATADAALLHVAIQAFAEGRRKRDASEAGLSGGEVSGNRRRKAAQAAAETIRAEWALPSADFPTKALIARSGLSLNTAKQYLGTRADAQRLHEANLKRAVARQKGGGNE